MSLNSTKTMNRRAGRAAPMGRLKNWLCFLAFLISLLQTWTFWNSFQVGEDPYLLETPFKATLSLAKSTTFQLRNNTTLIQSSSVNHWWSNFVDEAAVSFKKWESKYSWCLKDKPKKSGLLFVKTYKSGSSTALGVNLRISTKVGGRKRFSHCMTSFTHLDSLKNEQRWRQTKQSFMWTVVRHPARRAVSAYYFYQVGLNRVEATDESMLEYLQSTKNSQLIQLRDDDTREELKAKNGILNSMGGFEPSVLKSPTRLAKLLKDQIFDAYNFVAVIERWDESMVVLKMLLDLEMEDIISFPSKSSGGWSRDWQKGEACFHIPKQYTSAPVQDYLGSNYTVENGDYLLYSTAERSLDLTIEALGRQQVEADLLTYRSLRRLVEEKCSAKVVYPCSDEGKWHPEAKTECYWRDMGCGFRCVDEALASDRDDTLGIS